MMVRDINERLQAWLREHELLFRKELFRKCFVKRPLNMLARAAEGAKVGRREVRGDEYEKLKRK